MRQPVAIVQARMGSSRLPGKIFAPLLGKPVLHWVLTRLRRSRYLSEVVVATSDDVKDDQVETWCALQGWRCLRGSQDDVLGRYHMAAASVDADPIVRICADNPFIDPVLVDLALTTWSCLYPGPDYLSNCLRPSYPVGLLVEVFSRPALERAHAEDVNPAWREHVTPYLVRNPERFRQFGLEHPQDFSAHRWTLDTEDDLAYLRQLAAAMGRDDFVWTEALRAAEAHPEWRVLNSHVEQRQVD